MRLLTRHTVLALAALGASAVGGLAAVPPVAAAGAKGLLYGDFDVTVRMKTIAQLRTGSTPNVWERLHYLILKATGIEVGKADPHYGGSQRFLPYYEGTNSRVGSWNTVRVRMVGATMQIWVDGVLQFAQSGGTDETFTDTERPFLSGKFGFYAEDSEAEFDDFAMGRV